MARSSLARGIRRRLEGIVGAVKGVVGCGLVRDVPAGLFQEKIAGTKSGGRMMEKGLPARPIPCPDREAGPSRSGRTQESLKPKQQKEHNARRSRKSGSCSSRRVTRGNCLIVRLLSARSSAGPRRMTECKWHNPSNGGWVACNAGTAAREPPRRWRTLGDWAGAGESAREPVAGARQAVRRLWTCEKSAREVRDGERACVCVRVYVRVCNGEGCERGKKVKGLGWELKA